MSLSLKKEAIRSDCFEYFSRTLHTCKSSFLSFIWKSLLAYVTLYYFFQGIYHSLLNNDGKKYFENLVIFTRLNMNFSIPVYLTLGFYVIAVLISFWNRRSLIPKSDSIAVLVSSSVQGNDVSGRLMRRTIVRYVCLSLTMAMSRVFSKVKKHFNTLEDYATAGLILEDELESFRSFKTKNHCLPLVWASRIVSRARKDYRLSNDSALVEELNRLVSSCRGLVDSLGVPTICSRVVTLAVFAYFCVDVLAHQTILKEPGCFPVFSALEMIFRVGLLKLAVAVDAGPFGDVDEVVSRNLQECYLIVDGMHYELPKMVSDQYWDEPLQLPSSSSSCDPIDETEAATQDASTEDNFDNCDEANLVTSSAKDLTKKKGIFRKLSLKRLFGSKSVAIDIETAEPRTSALDCSYNGTSRSSSLSSCAEDNLMSLRSERERFRREKIMACV